jgi:hypothetical protein
MPISFASKRCSRHHPRVDDSAEVTESVSGRAAVAADVEQIRALAIGSAAPQAVREAA